MTWADYDELTHGEIAHLWNYARPDQAAPGQTIKRPDGTIAERL